MADSEDDLSGVPLIEDISSDEGDQASKKRKRDTETDAADKKAAKRKKRTKKKPQDIDDGTLDAELGINHAIAHMDSQLLVDHVAQRTKRFRPDVSIVEAEDLFMPSTLLRPYMKCLS